MPLQQSIKEEIKKAMLAKDALRLSVVRGISAAFTNELVAKMKKPTDALSDEDAMAVIKRLVKQRKDSIEQFTKGNRPDLVDTEKAELTVLETFMPKMMSRDEIKKIALTQKEKMNVSDKAGMGKLMGAVMKEAKGMADGGDVKAVVESLFA
ncbi:MAG: GatB/YqeY domain-containing protein [Candidatus Pacebacteria bacterium]|nr:GatB/YqeY domain-containing protein [Candidatus Paceibacterota bacterium]